MVKDFKSGFLEIMDQNDVLDSISQFNLYVQENKYARDRGTDITRTVKVHTHGQQLYPYYYIAYKFS